MNPRATTVRAGCFPFLLALLLDLGAAQSPNCTRPTQFFRQRVDHGLPAEQVFDQQYQILDDHFKPGGPILYYQQAETEVFACLEDVIINEWAAELGGMAVSLEHRFFGLSQPSNATDYVQKYQSLTLDNVMLDSTTFIDYVKRQIPGAEGSRVVVTGGSYGGFLTTALKMNHPETFDGAVAWAAPLQSVGANYQNPQRYEWFKYVNQIYRDLSNTGSQKIRLAYDELQRQFDADTDLHAIANQLNLCSTPASDSDQEALLAYITLTFSLIPQLDYQALAGTTPKFPNASAQGVIDLALNTPSGLDFLHDVLALYYPPPSYPCVDWNSTQKSAASTLQKIPFNYLLCNYFPLSSNEVPPGTIFPATAVQTESDPTSCHQLFNLTPPTQEYVQKAFHLTRSELVDAQRIIYAYNENDPVTAVGLDPFPVDQAPESARWMFTSMSAHGEESLASTPKDLASVVHARRVQLESIKRWFDLK